MKLTEVDAAKFQDMVRVASHRLSNNTDFVNSLNVFPVPDGDTGTNMNLTVKSGAKAVNESNAQTVGELGKVFAKGLLMGARGNSGVITSQLFRGFAKSLEGKTTLTSAELAAAFVNGVKTAYKAVMKPVEGTILTVARGAAQEAAQATHTSDDVVDILKALVKGAKKALATTPDLLPVLKQVGVVDSGGQGLVFIYEGFLSGVTGETLATEYQPDEAEMDEMVNATHHQSVQSQLSTADIQFGYCTEMMIDLQKESQQKFDYNSFRQHLSELGDSLLVVADEEVAKVHVHTENPGRVLAFGHQFGALEKIKIDNMRIQHETIVQHDEEPGESTKDPVEWGLVVIAAGQGVGDLYRSLGATYVLNGGQTMNPSTQDIANAIEEVHAQKVIVFPNNGNIFMAAQQAAQVAEAEVAIVPSKTIAQGMSALLTFNPQMSLAENVDEMTEALHQVKSGAVTQAIRDTEIDGLAIQKNHFMGIVDGKIKVDHPDLNQAARAMVIGMLDDESEIVTILVGEGATQAEAETLVKSLEDDYEDIEFEIHQGDQPVYPYLISVE